MCGIAGYINLLQQGNPISNELLTNMQHVMEHRGPDDFGIWKSDALGIGFAHRRLSILDLSPAGKQPMIDEEQSVVVCFNGEIYNHTVIRSELQSLGYSYRSRTDTETLLHAYKHWGIDFIDKLDGMFAFALFDIKKNELYLVRDRMGIKPLYFGIQNNTLCFGSEIKSFWQLPWMKKEVNPYALYHYFTFMVSPAPFTLYKGVYKLPAGYCAKIDAQRSLSFTEWYNPLDYYKSADLEKYHDENWTVDVLRDQLRKSVHKRMMSDVPVGAFLSGGIDSSLNVALMSEVSSKVETFNVFFEDLPQNDERYWARKVSKYFGTYHHEISLSEKDAFNFFEKMIYHLDEPMADSVCIPIYFIAKAARDAGVPVVQVGEGADELFSGYQIYARYLSEEKRLRPFLHLSLPKFVRKALYEAIIRLVTLKDGIHLDSLKNWVNGRHLFWGGALSYTEEDKGGLFSILPKYEEDVIVQKIYPQLAQMMDSYNFVDYHLSIFAKKRGRGHFLDRMIYLELKQRLPELLLARFDKMSMATSVEGRVSFLDHTFVEHALRVPHNLKYKNGETKYIIKKVSEGILPHDVIYRKKVGFGAPAEQWLRDGKYFKDFFPALLAQQSDSLDSWIDIGKVKKMYDDHVAQRGHYSLQLWTIQTVLQSLA